MGVGAFSVYRQDVPKTAEQERPVQKQMKEGRTGMRLRRRSVYNGRIFRVVARKGTRKPR